MISIISQVSKDHIMLDEHIEFTITLKNTSNIILNNVILYNNSYEKMVFDIRSLKLDGREVHIHHWEKGIFIGNLNSGEEKEINFRARALSGSTSDSIESMAIAKYTYTESDSKKFGISNSNLVEIKIINTELTVINQARVSGHNQIEYITSVVNTGKFDAKDVILVDILPSNLSLDDNTIYVNGILSDSNDVSYLLVGDIPIEQTVTITFKATIIEHSHLEMKNFVIAYFNYILEDGRVDYSSSKPSESRIRSSYSYNLPPVDERKRMI